MARPLLMDVDTGIDDAIAIALATRLREHELLAISTVAGNVAVEHSTRNTLAVLEWIGVDVPVYRGMNAPLTRRLQDARDHHGQTGLGSWQPPIPRRTEEALTGPEAIIRLARERQGEITFVFTGPLTNLAVALSLEPRLVRWVHQLVIMGGAFFRAGNTTLPAEFNIHTDPEAAAVVARSGMNATWVGLDVTLQTRLMRARWDELHDAAAPGESLVREVLRRTFEELGRPSAPMHDPLAVAVAELPEIAELERGVVCIDAGEMRRGETRIAMAAAEDAQSSVARTVNVERFAEVFGWLCPLQ
jgi:purine nucleosidase